MKKIFLCIALVFAATAVVIVVLGLRHFNQAMEMGFDNPLIYESISPGKMGKALFVTQGFQDRGIYLYINDPGARQECIDVGTIYWSHTTAVRATWSKDGSIIACENEMRDKEYFSYIYDFQKDSLYYPPGISRCGAEGDLSDEAWSKHSQDMKVLIEERGGPGKAIALKVVYGNGYAPSIKEWRRMRKAYNRFEPPESR